MSALIRGICKSEGKPGKRLWKSASNGWLPLCGEFQNREGHSVIAV